MPLLPTHVYTVEHVRQLDAYAIRQGIPGYTLMTRAGTAALRVLRERWPDAKRLLVVCGSGNNAGDGYVLARLARDAQFEVHAIAVSDSHTLRGDALTAFRDFEQAGGTALPWTENWPAVDVIVDALFGIGLSRQLDAQWCRCVQTLNAARVPILALDIPSGVHGDTGRVMGAAVKATCTITFVGLKLGLYLGEAPDHVGALEFDDLDSPRASIGPDALRLGVEWLSGAIPKRSRLAHKGSNGHVLLIGGAPGMAGAVRLAGEACLRVGAGLVTVATHPESATAIVRERPELIVRKVVAGDELQALIERADVVAIGPGLGQDEWAQALFAAAMASDKLKVLDADALNLLAKTPRRGDWILTPHPGEAGRLLETSTQAIQADRLGSIKALMEKYGGIVVLKGAHTVIARAGEVPNICDVGNPAMATAGMGDVLTGVIAGLLAQLRDPWAAARAGVVAHAWAGDRAVAKMGGVDRGVVDRGVIASDLLAELPACVHS